MARMVEGTIHKHPHGFGFLKLDEPGQEDVYLPAGELAGVMDGDRIKARLGRWRGRISGRLVEVLERRHRFVMGTFRKRRTGPEVTPLDPTIDPVQVTVACEPPPRGGEVVKVRLTGWPTDEAPARGEVVETLGAAGDPMQEVLSIAFSHGFADAFPDEVVEESLQVPDHVRLEDAAGRRDLRELPLVTIDGADAKDFDDAVFAERVPGGGYRLVVAIADVAAYVREGTALDREALARATSVYFPDMVLPMLPERLSNGICSLRPGVDRLCMVADLTLTPEGKTVNTEIYEGVMRSHARLTYEEVAAMMGESDAPVPEAHRWWGERHLEPAVELSKKLHALRRERGSIDLDLPEPFVKLGDDHFPVAILKRERKWAHRLIEEFMLAANEAVAFWFGGRGLPTIYRVHDDPDEVKLAAFAALARVHGFALTPGDEITPRKLNQLLGQLSGHPQQEALSHLLLRSMQQAIYSGENIGHFGLAASHYLHFTSPIRRYPDLMVHRLLKRGWRRAGRAFTADEREQLEIELDRVAAQSSERERAAMDAEREADAWFACLWMKDEVGETFQARVTSVTDFGLFVELDDAFVQGLVRAERLGGSVDFDAEKLRLIVDGRAWTIGDGLEVVCTAVDPAKRRIDFDALAAVEAEAEARSTGRRKTRPSKGKAGTAGKGGKAGKAGKKASPSRGGGKRSGGGAGHRGGGKTGGRKGAAKPRGKGGRRGGR